MRIIPFLFLLAIQPLAAFTDWVTTDVPKGGLVRVTSATESHSHAVGNGIVFAAFIRKVGEVDQLHLVSREVYQSPTNDESFTSGSSTLIDSAESISSVQIRHDLRTGRTHLTYSVREIQLLDNFPQPAFAIRHATYLDASTPLSIQDVIPWTFNLTGQHFHLSMELKKIQPGQSASLGMAFYQPGAENSGQLFYTEMDESGNWTTETISSAQSSGSNCDLAFLGGILPSIVYESPAKGSIGRVTKDINGIWNASMPANASLNGAVFQPDLFVDQKNGETIIAYISKNGNNYALKLILIPKRNQAVINLNVDTIINAVQSSSLSSISHPEVAISEGRIIVSYSKSFSKSEPWIAVRRSDSMTFQKEKLPGFSQEANHPTALSLDENLYPIVTWTHSDTTNPQVCYCPDFTDHDHDGIPRLHELAFAMNPEVPDAHLAPQPAILQIPVTLANPNLPDPPELPHFAIVFRLHSLGTVDPVKKVIHAGPFRYSPMTSADLSLWENESDIKAFSPSSTDIGLFQLLDSLPSSTAPKKFLSIGIFRK